MILSFIVAIGKDRQMGIAGKLPWHIKADFQNFKKITMHHHLLMGRKTYASIGKPLPGRTSIVVTRNPAFSLPPGHFVTGSLEAGIELAAQSGETELFVLGGGEIFSQLLPRMDKLYLSLVDYTGEADTYFPAYQLQNFKLREELHHPAEAATPAWTYQVWERF